MRPTAGSPPPCDTPAPNRAAARDEAETHGVVGERATSQAQRAFVLAFTHPGRADDELHLADQLLTGLDLRATTLTTRIAALVRDAGTTGDLDDRVRVLRTEIGVTGLLDAQVTLELAAGFHHAVTGAHDELALTISRLRDLTRNGDHAYYTDIAHFMGALPLPGPSAIRWTTSEDEVRSAWRGLVQARQEYLLAGN